MSAVPPARDSRRQREWNEAMFRKHGNLNRFHHPNPLLRALSWWRIRTALGLLSEERHHRVLDVGCGAGVLLKQVTAADKWGLDFSDTAIRQSRSESPAVRNSRWLLGDGHHLPFRARSFDRIACTEALEHMAEPVTALAEMARVARPGARVVLSVPYESHIHAVKRLIRRMGLPSLLAGAEASCEDEWHLHAFTPQILSSLAGRYFEVERIVQVPPPPFAIRIFAVCRPLDRA